MRLLFCITNQVEKIDSIYAEIMAEGLCGATTIDGKGMVTSLNESKIDPPPIFGSLRQFVHPDKESTKIILMALSEDKVALVRSIIRKHLGDLSQPDTGILFEMPIENVEGIMGA